MNDTPTVSVITPVYNGERHLAECIESVLRQTRTDFEYIIVDNQSRDQSPAIAQHYAARDGRIRLMRPDEFVDVHQNFNRSVRLADPRARYIKFLCADDWLYPECLERMVSVADKYPRVGVVSSYRHIGNLGVDQYGLVPYTQETMPGAQVVHTRLLPGPNVTGSQSQLLYRADLVRSRPAFFDDRVWHADTDAAFRTLLECDLGFVHQVLTYTRIHADSLTASFADRIRTFTPMEIRMVIRYGPRTLSPAEYRTALRFWLKKYSWFLFKQRLKPSRFRDSAFHEYHRTDISRMLEELGDDPETRIALKTLRLLLRSNRPAIDAAPQPTSADTGR